MKVKELIDKLQEFDPETEVRFVEKSPLFGRDIYRKIVLNKEKIYADAAGNLLPIDFARCDPNASIVVVRIDFRG